MERKIHAPEKELLSAKEAADWLNIPESTFDRLVEDGRIPPGLVLGQRTVRWEWETVYAVRVLLRHLQSLRPAEKSG